MTAETKTLHEALTRELETLGGADAKRLSRILAGMFTCLQDLDRRTAELEKRLRIGRDEEIE